MKSTSALMQNSGDDFSLCLLFCISGAFEASGLFFKVSLTFFIIRLLAVSATAVSDVAKTTPQVKKMSINYPQRHWCVCGPCKCLRRRRVKLYFYFVFGQSAALSDLTTLDFHQLLHVCAFAVRVKELAI